MFSFFFFFNDTATTEIYTLSLHDALPISHDGGPVALDEPPEVPDHGGGAIARRRPDRSEEHTSELQSLAYIVCRLLLVKKKKEHNQHIDRQRDHDEIANLGTDDTSHRQCH